MPHTEDLSIFARVVELGSLSAAGRDLRLSPAVVSNMIATDDLLESVASAHDFHDQPAGMRMASMLINEIAFF